MKRKERDDESKSWSYKNDFPIEEVWNTYHYIAQAIVPRLKAFKALDKHGHAPGFSDINAWNKAIQKMIDENKFLRGELDVYWEIWGHPKRKVVDWGCCVVKMYLKEIIEFLTQREWRNNEFPQYLAMRAKQLLQDDVEYVIAAVES